MFLSTLGIYVSPDNKYLFVPYYPFICFAKTLPSGTAVYTTASNELVTQLPTAVSVVAFGPRRKLAFIAGVSTISVVSTETLTVVKTLQFPSLNLTSIVLSPDGLTLYGLSNNALAVINLENDQIVNQFPVMAGSSSWSLAITSDGSTLLISNLSTPNQTKLGLMSTATGALLYVETGSVTPVWWRRNSSGRFRRAVVRIASIRVPPGKVPNVPGFQIVRRPLGDTGAGKADARLRRLQFLTHDVSASRLRAAAPSGSVMISIHFESGEEASAS